MKARKWIKRSCPLPLLCGDHSAKTAVLTIDEYAVQYHFYLPKVTIEEN